MSQMIRILVVDDETSLCDVTKEFLEMSKDLEVDTVCSVDHARTALCKNHYDVIVSDYQMPSEDGIQFLKSLRSSGNPIPYILFTGKGREEVVIEALNSGADFYLQKGVQSSSIYAEMEHHIRVAVEKQRTEDALRENEEKYHSFFTTSRDCVFITTADGRWVDFNDAAVELFGYESREDLLKTDVPLMYANPSDRDAHARYIREKEFSFEYPVDLKKKDGTIIHTLITSVVRKDPSGNTIGFQGSIRDITERNRTEKALRETQAQLRVAMDLAKLVHWEYDVATDTFTFDDQFYALFGTTAEREGGTKMRSSEYAERFLPPEEAPIVGRETEAALLTRDPNFSRQIEHDIIRRDGERRTIAVVFRVVKDPSGRTIKTYGANQDITERRRGEEALRESEEKYRLLVESAAEVIVVAQDGMLRLVNLATTAMTGLSEQELMSKPFSSFIHPDDRAMVVENYQRRLRGEAVPDRYAFRLLTKDERTRWVDLNAILIDWEGRPASLNFMTDITERKRIEVALHEANRKLNLLSSITRHDINNHLTVLKGNLTLLEKKQLDHPSDDHLQKAEAAAERISAMIQFTKEYEDIGVHALIWQDVHGVVKKVADQVFHGPIKVVNDVLNGIEILADPLIVKVFHNLIDNSMRHGGHVTRIKMSAEQVGDALLIVYEDDGVGISVEDREHLFEKGYGKNTGLGLFFIRDILAITGITITDNGKVGQGVRFEMMVPSGSWRRISH